MLSRTASMPAALGLIRSIRDGETRGLPERRRRLFFIGCSSYTAHEHPGTGRRQNEHSPKRDHGRRSTFVSPLMRPQLPGPRYDTGSSAP
jgi:hypothetical protein